MLSYINFETKAKGQVETRSKNVLYLQANLAKCSKR
jgi:hypothetical protein